MSNPKFARRAFLQFSLGGLISSVPADAFSQDMNSTQFDPFGILDFSGPDNVYDNRSLPILDASFVTIFDGISRALDIFKTVKELFFGDSENKSSVCDVPKSFIASLEDSVYSLAITVLSQDYVPTTVDGNRGLIADLHNYLEKRSDANWQALRSTCIVFFAQSRSLLSIAIQFRSIEASIDYKKQLDDFRKIEAALRTTSYLEKKFVVWGVRQRETKRSILDQLLQSADPLPDLLKTALSDCADIENKRKQIGCK